MEGEKGEKIIIFQLYNVNNMMIKIIIADFQELCLNNPSDKVTFQDVEEKLNEVIVQILLIIIKTHQKI